MSIASVKLSEKTERTIGTSVSMIEVAKPQAKKSVVTEARAGRLLPWAGGAVLMRGLSVRAAGGKRRGGASCARLPRRSLQCNKNHRQVAEIDTSGGPVTAAVPGSG